MDKNRKTPASEMSMEQNKELAECLKQASKELIDGIGTDTEAGQRVVSLIYDFIRRGFLECRAEKAGAGHGRAY